MSHETKTRAELLRIIASYEAVLARADETENKSREAEEKLVESEKRYRMLTDNIPLGIYRRTCGPEGKLVMVNPALVAMFGYDSADELNEVPMRQLYYHREEVEAFSEKLFKDREVIRQELKLKRKDGAPIWVAVTATMVCDEGGRAVFFDGIMEDITEKRQQVLDEALRRQQLVQADKMISLGILVSGVAHEINNPTQFIVSHMAPLKKAWDDALPILDRYYEDHGDFLLGGALYSRRRERIAEMFQNIREGTDRIRHIVDELRDYARESPADLSPSVQLNDVLRSALSLLHNLIRKCAGEFFVTYGKDLPPFKGDYRQIEQVIINLVQNACQALPDRSGKISIATYRDAPSGCLVVQVNDTGCGIPEEDLARITDPFFTTKRDIGGTGLGLSISQTIAAKHGGRLVFTSEVSQGTTVKLLLPAAE
jgi:two-component system NtrC family sensor kinase